MGVLLSLAGLTFCEANASPDPLGYTNYGYDLAAPALYSGHQVWKREAEPYRSYGYGGRGGYRGYGGRGGYRGYGGWRGKREAEPGYGYGGYRSYGYSYDGYGGYRGGYGGYRRGYGYGHGK